MGKAVDRSKWFSAGPIIFQVLKTQNTKGDWARLFQLKGWKNKYNPDWRIYCRSSSDDKRTSPIAMFFNSLDAMAEGGLAPNLQCENHLDFGRRAMEEGGGEGGGGGGGNERRIPLFFARRRVLTIKPNCSDLMLDYGWPRTYAANEPTPATELGWISEMTLTTYGPKFHKHSGHYGNYAPIQDSFWHNS